MNALNDIGQRFLKVDPEKILARVLIDNKDFLVEENIDSWNEGRYPESGDFIEPAYTPFTVSKKKEKGQEYDFVTLQDTGSHADKTEATIGSDFVELDSTDSKSQKLKDKYGDIFGIGDFAVKQIQEITINKTQNELTNF